VNNPDRVTTIASALAALALLALGLAGALPQ
jgi:hypothetical protein